MLKFGTFLYLSIFNQLNTLQSIFQKITLPRVENFEFMAKPAQRLAHLAHVPGFPIEP
jgi:hypothetical protein